MNWKNLFLSVHSFAALLVASSVNAQNHWEFVNFEWYENVEYQNQFLGVYFDFETDGGLTQFTGEEVGATDNANPPSFGGAIVRGSGVFALDFSDEEDDVLETAFFSRSGNHFLGTGPVTETGYEYESGPGSSDLRQGSLMLTGFRTTPSVAANPAGDWQGLQIEIGVAGNGSFIDWGYEIYEADFPGGNVVNLELTESSIYPDETGEQNQLTFTVQGNRVLVDTGDDEPAAFSMSATGDLMWTREIEEEESGTVYLLNNSFLKAAASGSFNMQDLAGSWATTYLELEKGGFSSEWPWHSLLTESGLVDLRADGTGSLYLIKASSPREYFDSEDVVTHFSWSIQGSHVVLEGEQQILVANSKEYMRTYAYETETDREAFSVSQLIRIDGPIHPAVKAIPLFTPTTGAWGKFMDQGWMYIDSWPWVYTEIMGWQRVLDEGNGHFVWVYDLQLGWLRTDYDMFPWFYGDGAGEIYYVDVEASTAGNRKIYSVHEGMWVD